MLTHVDVIVLRIVWWRFDLGLEKVVVCSESKVESRPATEIFNLRSQLGLGRTSESVKGKFSTGHTKI
jgi:hypothetical protein